MMCCKERNTSLFYLDTEGWLLDVNGVDSDLSIKVLSLIFLISSLIIFNSKECISNQEIGYISGATSFITNNEKLNYSTVNHNDYIYQSNQGSDSKNNASLLWIVRDCPSKISFDFDGFFKVSTSPKNRDYNKELLLRFFKEKEGICLTNPFNYGFKSSNNGETSPLSLSQINYNGEVKLENSSQFSKSPFSRENSKASNFKGQFGEHKADLSTEFKISLVQLKARINAILIKKESKIVSGRRLTASLLLEIIDYYVRSMNEGTLPKPETIWSNVVQRDINIYHTQALNAFLSDINYDPRVKDSICLEDSELMSKVCNAKFNCLKQFEICRLKDSFSNLHDYRDIFETAKDDLIGEIKRIEKKLLEKNFSNTSDINYRLLASLIFSYSQNKDLYLKSDYGNYQSSYIVDFKDKLSMDNGKHATFVKDSFISFFGEYATQSMGPSSLQNFADFLLKQNKLQELLSPLQER